MRAELAARKMSELLRASANTVVLKVASVWPAAGAAPLAAPESSRRCKMGTKSVAKAFLSGMTSTPVALATSSAAMMRAKRCRLSA